MQEKRPKQVPPARTPRGDLITVPSEYWDELQNKTLDKLCRDSMASLHPPQGLRIPFLQGDLLIDIQHRSIYRIKGEHREAVEQPLLELIALVYLLNVTPAPLSQDMVGPNDLKDAHFFQGPHALKMLPVLERYGRDLEGFKRAAKNLNGEPLDLADAAYRLAPFPKIPLYYLLWEGDEEFAPHLSILFDRSIERHLSADAIWGLVNLVSTALLMSG
ncbi:MAG: DUF3786 domain-containing protein [Proteobacteria bacterium]|nr:DUF3786 domain-containing protein [Pseudomonadota bacterium]